MNDERLRHNRQGVKRRAVEYLIEQILLADHAEDLAHAPLAHQKLLVPALAEGPEDGLAVILGINPLDLQARGHDVADAPLVHRENALNGRLLRFLDEARLPARCDEELDLFGRMKRFLGRSWPQADQPQHPVPEPVQKQDGRTEDEQEKAERAHDEERRLFASLKGKALRREFAENDMQCGNDGEGDRDRNGVSPNVRKCSGYALQQRFD